MNNTQRNKEIGNTIWSQMKMMDMNLIWCMGVQKPAIIENGLQFEVNGLTFKGVVQVTLNGKDLYDVKFVKKMRKANQAAKELGVKMYDTYYHTVSQVNDLYAEDLMSVLEKEVEGR